MPALRTLARRTALGVAALVLAVGAWDIATYDADAWGADHARLKHDMAQGYANLDWMVSHRGLDLAALDRRTTDAIAGAHSRLQAFLALMDFVEAFRDPHVQLRLGERSESMQGAGPVSSDTQDAEPVAGAGCASAGYEEGDHAFKFPFAAMPGWIAVSTGNFPSGLVGDTGVLRIAQLGEERYLGACNAVFRAGIGQRALQLAVRRHQQAALRSTIDTLRARGATRLLVDVTGNGGGSEWVSEVIALFTDRTLSRSEARIVGPTCDRSAVWSGANPSCDVFAGEATTATLQGTGAWTGPLLVLADAGTASAAEDLVAWLGQNDVATVLGERTMGAGCGYVDGGTVTQLAQIPFDVHMPNCARFLSDGTNEVEGIAPQVALSGDPDAQAVALARWLDAESVPNGN